MKPKLKQLNGGGVAGHIITDASGNVSALKHNLSASTNPTATDDGPDGGYAVGSIWINTTGDRGWICLDATDDAAIWRAIGERDSLIARRSGIDITYNEGVKDYVEVQTTTYEVIASFIFPGTGIATPEDFKCITSLSAAVTADGRGYLRVYDLTNAQVIAEMRSDTVTGKAINSTSTIANLPASEAIFEIQAHKSSVGVGKLRIHYSSLR